MRIFIVWFLFFICACSPETTKHSILTENNLPLYLIRVNPSKDTSFLTPKGAIIKIKAGTFDEEVELQLREAYSISDMIQAGLTTQSNGQFLKSGGMIQFLATKENNYKLNHPIEISIPSNSFDSSMVLYKGTRTSSGNMNWIQTDTLKQPEALQQLSVGKQLFKQNCAACHAINKNLTGPALAGITDRGPWKDRTNLYNWIRNPARFMATSSYAQALKTRYGVIMQAFPALSDTAIDAIIAFIESEQYKAYPNDAPFTPDSVFYQIDSNVVVSGWEREFYNFEISTLGWYNIDALLKEDAAITWCTLGGKISNVPSDSYVEAYLLLPERKVFISTQVNSNGTFSFEEEKGKVPLFLGDKAYLIAFTRNDNSIYYGKKEFTIQRTQKISIELKPVGEQEFAITLKELELSEAP